MSYLHTLKCVLKLCKYNIDIMCKNSLSLIIETDKQTSIAFFYLKKKKQFVVFNTSKKFK